MSEGMNIWALGIISILTLASHLLSLNVNSLTHTYPGRFSEDLNEVSRGFSINPIPLSQSVKALMFIETTSYYQYVVLLSLSTTYVPSGIFSELNEGRNMTGERARMR